MTFSESPYELVLYLLDKRNLDLTTQNLIDILTEFWSEIENKPIATEFIGDFLVAFSKLLVLKINYLLDILEEKPEILLDLQKYRTLQKARKKLKKITDRGPIYFSRKFVQVYGFLPSLNINQTTLRLAIQFILSEKTYAEKEEVIAQRVSLAEAFQTLQDILAKEKKIVLQDRFVDKDLLIALFLAMLIWFREGKLEIEQENIFGKIEIKTKNDDETK